MTRLRRFLWPSVRSVLEDDQLSGDERREAAECILDQRRRRMICAIFVGGAVMIVATALLWIFLR